MVPAPPPGNARATAIGKNRWPHSYDQIWGQSTTRYPSTEHRFGKKISVIEMLEFSTSHYGLILDCSVNQLDSTRTKYLIPIDPVTNDRINDDDQEIIESCSGNCLCQGFRKRPMVLPRP